MGIQPPILVMGHHLSPLAVASISHRFPSRSHLLRRNKIESKVTINSPLTRVRSFCSQGGIMERVMDPPDAILYDTTGHTLRTTFCLFGW